MATGKPTLNHLNNSQSQVVLWLLEELGIEYDINFFERGTFGTQKNRAPAKLKEFHPLGKSPQLITPEGRVIIERDVILKYLIDRYDQTGKFKVNPNDKENDILLEEQFISFGANSLSFIFMLQMIFGFLKANVPFFLKPLVGAMAGLLNKGFAQPENDLFVSWIEDNLKGKEYFMNTKEPTRVDFSMLWYLDLAMQAGVLDASKYPNLKAWHERCKARDGWKRSIEKGNGYDMDMKF